MMNYIKSEIYRVSHSKDIYCFIAILSGLSFLANAVLGWFGKMDADFRYNTTSYSYSNLVAFPMVFCLLGAITGVLLYEGNRKNGTLKNTVAFGIPRTKIFAGECIVSVISAVISLIIVLAVYVSSAVLFLKPEGPVSLTDLFTEIPAVFLTAVASLICGLVLIEVFSKEITAGIIWAAIWVIIPNLFFYLGLKIDIFFRIAIWMPYNFFSSRMMTVNMSQCITAWGTAAEMIKCIAAGAVGVLVFSLAGVVLLRKREL